MTNPPDTIRRIIDLLHAETLKALKARPVPDRGEAERKLTAAAARELARQKRRLLTLLGDPPNPANVPESFWTEAGAEMSAALRPVMQATYLAGAMETVRQTGAVAGVDWTLVNRAAVTWADRYAFDLVKGITQTTRDGISQAVTRFFETPGMTRGELEALLSPTFGPARASMIGVTEVTRAASEGQTAIAQEVRAGGIVMLAVWNTDNDELVCPLCGPLNQVRATEYIDGRPWWTYTDEDGNEWTVEQPPRHVNCRCHETWELPARKGGPGSGNFGHAGRPGEVGGSGEGGGSGKYPTGKPVTEKVYRGVSESGPADPGDFGRGTYYSTDESTARQYGKVSAEEITLENPLFIPRDKAPNFVNHHGTLTGSLDERKEKAAKLTADLMARGYDGLIIDGWDGPPGTYTFVKFPKQ